MTDTYTNPQDMGRAYAENLQKFLAGDADNVAFDNVQDEDQEWNIFEGENDLVQGAYDNDLLDAIIMTGAGYSAYKLAQQAFRVSEPTPDLVQRAAIRMKEWDQKNLQKSKVKDMRNMTGSKMPPGATKSPLRQNPLERVGRQIGDAGQITKGGRVQYGVYKFTLNELQMIKNTPGFENLSPSQKTRFLGSEFAKLGDKGYNVTKINKPTTGGRGAYGAGGGMDIMDGPFRGPLRDDTKKRGM